MHQVPTVGRAARDQASRGPDQPRLTTVARRAWASLEPWLGAEEARRTVTALVAWAMADAALTVFADPATAFNHLATARVLDPRIPVVIEQNRAHYRELERHRGRDPRARIRERLQEVQWRLEDRWTG